MKLNYKRTIHTSFVFFTICMAFQLMDTYLPVFLSDMLVRNYGGSSTEHSYIIGLILAAGNIFSLITIPLISVLSDKTKSSYGKRTPYIVWGVFTQIIMFPILPILYMANYLGWFIAVMILSVLIINTYRVPVVSLMPDVTPKPLRNKANSIVYFIGYLGMVFASILAIIFPVNLDSSGMLNYNPNTLWIPFVVTMALMFISVLVTVAKINENKLAISMRKEMELGERIAETDAKLYKNQKLTSVDKRNIIAILFALLFWNIGFVVVQNYGSLFGLEVLGVDTRWWGIMSIIITLVGMISFIPAGHIADKIGRKNTLVTGLCLLMVSIGVGCFVRATWVFYIIAAVAGVGWAIVNVISYPMVVEFATNKSVGWFTSQYYFFKGIGVALTPILASVFFAIFGYEALFVYATIFLAISTLCAVFYKVPEQHKEDEEEKLKPDTSNSKFWEDY